MNNDATHRVWWKHLSPATTLISIAALLWLAFAAMTLAGWREHTTFLSLTPTSVDGADDGTTLGISYVVSYLLATIVAPVLALAAAIHGWFKRLENRNQPRPPAEVP
ncbi:MAG TPA: hypothetical protein DCY13_08700 [Verrucomicrobiales bacterium]|nr:hypothetical protein [Verrucomicrobiales bacterium]